MFLYEGQALYPRMRFPGAVTGVPFSQVYVNGFASGAPVDGQNAGSAWIFPTIIPDVPVGSYIEVEATGVVDGITQTKTLIQGNLVETEVEPELLTAEDIYEYFTSDSREDAFKATGFLTSLGSTAPAGWINADAIVNNALNDKGNWNVGKTGYSLSSTGMNGVTLPANIITASSIASNAITDAKIASNAISAAKIASNAITAAKIADNAFTASKFAAGSLNGKGDWNIGKTGYSLTTTAYSDISNRIALDITDQLNDWEDALGEMAEVNYFRFTFANSADVFKADVSNVTVGAIANNAITASSIASGALNGKGDWNIGKTGYSLSSTGMNGVTLPSGIITASSIASNAITDAKIASNAITAAKIASNAITDTKIAAGALTSAKFASGAFDAVWSVTTRLLTAGTNIVLAKGTGITGFNDLSASQVENAVWDATMSSHLTSGSTGAALNAAGSAGDPWETALPGSYAAGTAGHIIGNRLDAAVSSRSSHTAANVWSVGTRTITGGTVTTVSDKTGYSLASTGMNGVTLPSGIITASSIASNAITDAKIASGALNGKGNWNIGKTGYSLTTAANEAISNQIATSITNETEGWDQGLEQISAATWVNSSRTLTGPVSVNSIANNTITAASIASNAITDAKIASNAITAAKIAAGALNGKGDWNIGKTGYQLSSQGEENIYDYFTTSGRQNTFRADVSGLLDTSTFNTALPSNFSSLGINASGHISRVTLVDTTTANTDMRGTDNALTTLGANAPSGWINAASIASNAITDSKIASNAITAAKIASNAITSAKIADGALTASKFAAGAFDAVWSVSTRTLTSFGTLVADVTSAVWSATTRTLTLYSDSSGVTTLLSRVIGTIASGTHQPQSGDSFTRLGAPVGASISADIQTRLPTSSYVAPANADIAAIKVVTDKLDTTLEVDGSNYRFTEDALALAPVSSGGDTAASIYTYFTSNNRQDEFKATGFSTHTAQDVADSILENPSNKLFTNAEGRVSVYQNIDKTGYSLSSSARAVMSSQIANDIRYNTNTWEFANEKLSEIAYTYFTTDNREQAFHGLGTVESIKEVITEILEQLDASNKYIRQTVICKDSSGNPVQYVKAWLTSDIKGEKRVTDVMISNEDGALLFFREPNVVRYLWRYHPTVRFENPIKI